MQKAVQTMTLIFLVKNDILINKIIKNVIFSASKENRHYNMYGEKKPRLAVSRGLLIKLVYSYITIGAFNGTTANHSVPMFTFIKIIPIR